MEQREENDDPKESEITYTHGDLTMAGKSPKHMAIYYGGLVFRISHVLQRSTG
jgi:hypothetical protein